MRVSAFSTSEAQVATIQVLAGSRASYPLHPYKAEADPQTFRTHLLSRYPVFYFYSLFVCIHHHA